MLVDPSVLISSLLGLLYLFAAVSFAHSDGVRYTPAEIRGWSTKYIARSNPTEELITSIATFLSTSQFAVAGYKYIIIDDGWTTCRSFVSGNQGTCAVAGERDDAGKLIADPNKFPRGLKALADFVHSKGLKLGLYAAISKTTCSGFTGSLGHEAVDAVTFADWGIDLVKHAACNPADCGINNGCLQNSTLIMANALKDSGREIVYYIDAGGKLPNRPRVYNPRSRSVPSAANGIGAAQNLVWTWAPERAHMWKNSPDMVDSFSSMLDNLRHQARIAEYQHCGSFNFPGELTVGLGNQTFKEYRSQFLLWSIQGAPLILGGDVRTLAKEYVDLFTNAEVLAVNGDSDCTQGSQGSLWGPTEVWTKPLSGGRFATVVVNKWNGPYEEDDTQQIVANFEQVGSLFGAYSPATFHTASSRDLLEHKDLGNDISQWGVMIEAHDAGIYKFTVDGENKLSPARGVTYGVWILFITSVVVAIGIDMVCIFKTSPESPDFQKLTENVDSSGVIASPSGRVSAVPKNRAVLSCVFFLITGILFNVLLGWAVDSAFAAQWFTAYVLEYTLSFDNLFVFYLVFKSFGTPVRFQHRILFLGMLGALGSRLMFIFVSVAALNSLWWIKIVLALLLLYTSVKTALFEDDEDDDGDDNEVVEGEDADKEEEWAESAGSSSDEGAFFDGSKNKYISNNVILSCFHSCLPISDRYPPDGSFVICGRATMPSGTTALKLEMNLEMRPLPNAAAPASGNLPNDDDTDTRMNLSRDLHISGYFLGSDDLDNGNNPFSSRDGLDDVSDTPLCSSLSSSHVALPFSSSLSPRSAEAFLTRGENYGQPVTAPPHPSPADARTLTGHASICPCHFTPLFAVLLTLEIVDILFAVDSVTAKLSISSDLFTNYTSTIFGMLGLRSMYFLVALVVNDVVFLKYGISVILLFLSVKMILAEWVEISILPTLIVISLCLLISVALSFYRPFLQYVKPTA